jgi:hypothetical protein
MHALGVLRNGSNYLPISTESKPFGTRSVNLKSKIVSSKHRIFQAATYIAFE